MIEKIGKFRILERIGRGGMGTVFKAHDPVLDRLVAIKVISPEIEVTDELKARLFREAHACAKLNHRNIITVYELGEDEGRLFIVMEFLEGEELKQMIERRASLSLEEKLAIMAQICEGLHQAHQKGIIHRDMKPSNIFVLKDGQTKILDFGIARVVTSDSSLTGTGRVLGTLRYMAPEQVRGHVDHRSDIFSVGAVFYELLTWRRAFDGADPMEVLDSLRSEDPPRVDWIDASIPAELATLVERALRKDPAERFPHLKEMGARIEGVRRDLVEQAEGLRSAVAHHVEEVSRLEAELAERIGDQSNNTTVPIIESQASAASLAVLRRELPNRLDRLRDAIGCANKLEPIVARGLFLLDKHDFEGAMAEFERVLREMPEHARVEASMRRLRGAVEIALSHSAAIRIQTRVDDELRQAANRRAARAAFDEGKTLLANGDVDGAIDKLSDALRRDATHVEAGAVLAKAREQLATKKATQTEIARRVAAVEHALGERDVRAASAALERLAELAPGLPELSTLRVRVRRHRDRVLREMSPLSRVRAWSSGHRVASTAVVLLTVLAAIVAIALVVNIIRIGISRGVAEDARQKMVAARKAAAEADPELVLSPLWIAARTKEDAAEEPWKIGSFSQALAAYREARVAYERIGGEVRRVRMAQARSQAEQIEASRYAAKTWQDALGKDTEGQEAYRQGQYLVAAQRFMDAERDYQQARQEAAKVVEREKQEAERLAQQQRDAEQSRASVARARAQAEKANAKRYAAKAWQDAQKEDADAQAFLRSKGSVAAQPLLKEAQQAFERARSEALKAADAERQKASSDAKAMAASVADQERVTGTARDQALTSEADRLAKEIFDSGRAKESEAKGLLNKQAYAQAAAAYQDAAGLYGEANKRAQIVRQERTKADQARARMQAEKQKARPEAAEFKAALTAEKQAEALYRQLAFKEAADQYGTGQRLFAKAAMPGQTPRPLADPRKEIQAALDTYRRAIESKDLTLLRQIRPNLSDAELLRFRASFDESKSQTVDLKIEGTEVKGDEAQAKARRMDRLVSKDGGIAQTDMSVVFSLKRTTNGWVILAVR